MKKVIFLFLAAMLASCSSSSSKLPKVYVDFKTSFNTIDDCGKTMTEIALIKTQDTEFGGFCVKDKNTDKFYSSDPFDSKDTDSINYDAMIPSGYTLAAIYHTHPSGAFSFVYSDVDVKVATNLKVPSYLGVVDGRTIRRFTYGVDQTKWCFDSALNQEFECADGTILK